MEFNSAFKGLIIKINFYFTAPCINS